MQTLIHVLDTSCRVQHRVRVLICPETLRCDTNNCQPLTVSFVKRELEDKQLRQLVYSGAADCLLLFFPLFFCIDLQ